jgi:ribonuclease R
MSNRSAPRERAAKAADAECLVGSLIQDEQGRRRLLPFDSRLEDTPLVSGADAVEIGEYIQVEMSPARRGQPRSRLTEVLGPIERPGVDVAVVLRHYGIPDDFPAEVLRTAAEIPSEPKAEDFAGREDLRGSLIVTIDGARSRDFDDAVSIERLGNRTLRLGVHIADVGHYVTDGGVLDREAYRRGTSVYYPERAVPMLPERLSNGLCSLRPHSTRLTLSVFLDFDRDGHVVARRFAETVIRSARRMTYDEVSRLLTAPRENDDELYGDVLPMLRQMRHLMEILLHERARRGSIDFDLPEGDVVLDTDGHMVGIQPSERTVAHRIIEEFMIAANEAVASELDQNNVPALYRVHDAPELSRLAELREVLAPLGIDLPGELKNLHPEALQQVLRRAMGRPEEAFINSLVLRTMQRAFYNPECRGHYALAARYYTHFTSPIRRYPDLLIHRQLKRLLKGQAGPSAEQRSLRERLPAIAIQTSETEKRSEHSERELLQWKKVRYFGERIGERFNGRVTGVQPFGAFVRLEGYNVDGLVPVRTIGNEYFEFDAAGHRLVGSRSGRAVQLGDALEVELSGVDLRRRGLDLQIIQAEPAEKPKAGPPKAKRPRRRR